MNVYGDPSSWLSLLPIILGVIAVGCFFGFFTYFLAAHKGYGFGSFWLGFFFPILGLLYVIGLPLSPKRVLGEQKQLAALIAEAIIYEQEKE